MIGPAGTLWRWPVESEHLRDLRERYESDEGEEEEESRCHDSAIADLRQLILCDAQRSNGTENRDAKRNRKQRSNGHPYAPELNSLHTVRQHKRQRHAQEMRRR